MAHRQTNSVLVYVRMYTVTERGVVGLIRLRKSHEVTDRELHVATKTVQSQQGRLIV